MTKTLIFWCPYIGNVGTSKAVIESAKSFSKSKSFKCKIINSFGEFDNYRSTLKKHKIEEIKLLNNRLIKKLPTEGFFWSRLNYILVFIFCFFPLLFYLIRNKNNYLFIYLLTSLPLLIVSLFNLDNKIILRVSGKIKFTLSRKIIFFISRKKIFKVLIQTLEAKNRILKKNIFDKNTIKLIRDPVIDHKMINNLKRHPLKKFFKNRKYFISIGRLTYQKNFIFLVKCLKKIIDKDKKFSFLILGEGNERKKIEAYIKKYNLSNYIFLIGHKKNIFKYINNSLGLICTSLWEEPGFIIQEASACKKIILTSDCYTGPSEFLNYGQTGYVYRNNNIDSFLEKFKTLISEKKNHKKKIEINFEKTKLYTRKSFLLDMKKIL
jgi:glycosyltransferase involved in cell wall biosynthesis